MIPYNYIAIEGNIGVGKTSFATMLANRYNARLILEQFEGNAFLAKFYENPAKYAFPLELSFLAERYQQLQKDLNQQELFSSFTVSDYFINKSLIFARKTLQDDEFFLFKKLFEIINAKLPKPDLLVHLYVDVQRLQKNIKNRGRDYEQSIPDTYLEQIQSSYFDYIKQQPGMRILLVDLSNIDFVANKEDFNALTGLVHKDYPTGINYINI